MSQYYYAKIHGTGATDYEKRIDWQAQRSHDVFRIFGEVFGDENYRINRVLAVDESDTTLIKDVLNRFEDIRDDTIDFDVLAIGPKVAKNYTQTDCDNSWAGFDLVNEMEIDLPIKLQHISETYDIAQELGKKMVLYEAWYGAKTPDCDPNSLTIEEWALPT